MIFVTVGTTHFNDLIKEVDNLMGKGIIKGKVYAQIGSGTYIPEHVDWVRYLDNIQEVIKTADLVISHGGTGSIFETLGLGKPLIAVPNRQLQDDHQTDLLSALEEEDACNCCWQLSELGAMITSGSLQKAYEYRPELPKRVWDDLLADLSG